jgi:hypothetical protein
MVAATIMPATEKNHFCHLGEYLDVYGSCNNHTISLKNHLLPSW